MHFFHIFDLEGNHEKIVSKELFLKVNWLMDKNAHGYSVNEENNNLPLKRFIQCDECGRFMRGYIVQKKQIYYYKCNTISSGNNRSAKTLHERFAKILGAFRLDVAADLLQLIKTQTIATFNQLTKGHDDEYQVLQKQHQQLKEKISRLEERFIEEEIKKELYSKYSEKYTLEKTELEKHLLQASKKVSNLEECVDLAISFASKMPEKWLSADYLVKQQLQFLVFPEGIRYNKKNDGCRTLRINTVFALIARLKQDLTQQKSGTPELNLDYAALYS